MSSLVVKKSNLSYWICGILFFLVSQPIWTWNKGQFVVVVVPLLILMFTFRDIRKSSFGFWGVFAWLFQLLILGIFNIYPNTNIFGFLMLLLKWIGFTTIFLCSASIIRNYIECFIRILAFLLIISIIEHLLISFFGIALVSPSVRTCAFNFGRDYNVYLFNAYLQDSYDAFSVFRRFYAFYDEPGILGNIMMVLLYAQRFDLKKWYNIVFLISGLLSFSLAFYIALVAYYIIFGSTKTRVAFIIVALLVVYYSYHNEYLYGVLFSRFAVENGELVGYNRENFDFQNWFSRIQLNEYLYWGYRPKEAIPYAASWKWAFALIGVIPSILYLIALLMSRRKGVKGLGDLLKGLLIITIIWIQRPCVYSYLYVLLMVLPYIYYKTDHTITQTEKLDKDLLIIDTTTNG